MIHFQEVHGEVSINISRERKGTLKNEMTNEEVVLIGKWEGIQEVGFRDFIEEKPDGQFGKRNPINCSYRHFSLS